MQSHGNFFRILLLTVFFCLPLAARGDLCAICGKPILGGTIYLATDEVTGEKKEVCANCLKLPRCYVCSLPVKDGTELPDGRSLCARDAKTVVLKADEAAQICSQVKDDLDRLFSRFTTFPANVDVTVMDRVDVDAMYQTMGNNFESPNLLGCISQDKAGQTIRYKMRLMTGLPLAELKATCAHEYSHAWVGENVPKERRARLGRDAEEGFCVLVGYLLMDSQSEEGQKKFILKNHYTRGQINLFIAAEKRYGFDQVMDWMKYGVDPQLEPGRADEIRDVVMPSARPVAANATSGATPRKVSPAAPAPGNHLAAAKKSMPLPATLKLNGILWGNRPTAIINGHTFAVHDLSQVQIGGTNVTLRCLAIQQRSVRIQNADSGTEQELSLPVE